MTASNHGHCDGFRDWATAEEYYAAVDPDGELLRVGYDDERTAMVIEYSLRRWARGEEAPAQRCAIDREFYGIDLMSWLRVLAAAKAAAVTETTSPEKMEVRTR